MPYDALKLENQLCFPLYACARGVVKKYKPFLDEIGLTYTQYIVMMVLWEEESATLKSLGERLYLDSGTLTPLVKRLESLGYVERARAADDERSLVVSLTQSGRSLERRAAEIPAKIGACIDLSAEQAGELYALLYKVLEKLD